MFEENNTYPIINNINQILPLIENRREFNIRHSVFAGAKYSAVDYAIVKNDTFNDPLLRECRGLKFDPDTGKILARSIHKFYNVNEKPESQFENIPFEGIKHIYIKHDGTLIHPLVLKDTVVWMTKMGHESGNTEFVSPAAYVNEYAQDKFHPEGVTPSLIQAIKEYYKKYSNRTLLFEFVKKEPQGDVVSKYPEDRLYGLYSRNNTTGEYYDFPEELLHIPGIYKSVRFDPRLITSVRTTKELITALDSIKIIGEITGSLYDNEPIYEGFVIVMNNGQMFKYKQRQYVTKVSINTLLFNKRFMINKIICNRIDDIIPIALEIFPNRTFFVDYVVQVQKAIYDYIEDVNRVAEAAREKYPTAKDFAISVKTPTMSTDGVDPVLTAHVLSAYNGKNWFIVYVKNAEQDTPIDKFKGLIDRIDKIPFYGDRS